MNFNAQELAKANFDKFSTLEGSKHIATLSSQRNLAELAFRFKPKTILDWGSGIGTLTALVSKITNPKVYAYEESEYCKNLAKKYLDMVEIHYIQASDNLNQIEAAFIDASISKENITSILGAPNLKFIFIEGWRNSTVIQISRTLPKFGLSAKFKRGNGYAGYIINSKNYEKAGAWFVLRKSNRMQSSFSRVVRIWGTGEISDLILRNYFKAATATYKVRHPIKNISSI